MSDVSSTFETAVLGELPRDWRDVGLSVAVSGGADSLALLRAVCRGAKPGGRMAAAHFNHRLRGRESDQDEQLVRQTCDQLGIECSVGHAESGETRDDEASLRSRRYEFLQSAAERLGTRYLATAHTADDQAETVLHHIVRGTGLTGLSGIRRVRPLGLAVTLLRPMLAVTRAEVLAYLASLGQSFREDRTNREPRYTRNRIRHELLPLLERDFSPTVRQSLVRLAELAADAERIVDSLAEPLVGKSVQTKSAERMEIECRVLAHADRHVVRQVLLHAWRRQAWPMQSMGYAEFDQLAEMVLAPSVESSKRMLPGAISAQRSGDVLILSRNHT